MALNLSIVLVGALAGDVTGLETIAASLPADPPRCFHRFAHSCRRGQSSAKDSQRQGTTAGYACV
jgi:chemotaxis response regulator CheB